MANSRWLIWLRCNTVEAVKAKLYPNGEWTWLHNFKTCPTGDRHCPHYRWKRNERNTQ
jgi:hypothetical protein